MTTTATTATGAEPRPSIDEAEARVDRTLREMFLILGVDRDSEFGELHALELLACFFGAHPKAWEALRLYFAGEGEPDPLTAARTPGELRSALLPLLPSGRWDVRCSRWGLVAYPAEQTRSVRAAAAQA